MCTSSQFDLNVWHFHFAFPVHIFMYGLLLLGKLLLFVAFYGVLNEPEFRNQKLKLRNEDMPRGHATNKN